MKIFEKEMAAIGTAIGLFSMIMSIVVIWCSILIIDIFNEMSNDVYPVSNTTYVTSKRLECQSYEYLINGQFQEKYAISNTLYNCLNICERYNSCIGFITGIGTCIPLQKCENPFLNVNGYENPLLGILTLNEKIIM